MGKNKGKGGKNFRAGKKDREDTRRELLFKEEVAAEAGGGSGAPPQVGE